MPSVTSARWLVATSHPLAVQAALEMLEEGGNAVDAAVVAAAVLTVVDPPATGIGGDAFAMYWSPATGGPVGFAAAGPAPTGMSARALRVAGFEVMPSEGAWTITVPGAVAGWDRLLDRWGTIGLERALSPAVSIAEEGFEVMPSIASRWSGSIEKLQRYPYSASVYLPEGRAPEVGERMTNPDLATALRAIAKEGPGVFYEGWIAERIEAAVQDTGGPLYARDLKEWGGPRWVSPISARYRGVDVYELPPPNQGLLALQALKLYEGIETASRADEEHAAIEALKLAFSDAGRYIADPESHPVPIEGMLANDYISERRGLIGPASTLVAEPGRPGDTVYVAVMKGDEGCSFIQSIYSAFGSGVGAEGTGIILHNRGLGFVLEDNHPNSPEPGKRPYHTIIPAMLGCDGDLLGCLGVVGTFMQPQGHLQVLRNLLDRGADPQQALSAPRFRLLGGRRVGFEADFGAAIVEELAGRGHETAELPRSEAGGGQLIVRSEGALVGGSDPRKDGLARGG